VTNFSPTWRFSR